MGFPHNSTTLPLNLEHVWFYITFIVYSLGICDAGFEEDLQLIVNDEGKVTNNGTGICVPCGIGYWKNVRSAGRCQLCPVHLVTNGTGATSDVYCNLGEC